MSSHAFKLQSVGRWFNNDLQVSYFFNTNRVEHDCTTLTQKYVGTSVSEDLGKTIWSVVSVFYVCITLTSVW